MRSFGLLLLLTSCSLADKPATNTTSAATDTANRPLVALRRTLVARSTATSHGSAPPVPPRGVLELVQYDAPNGKTPAYLTPRFTDGKKHPAIVWIHGGFDWGIGPLAWEPAPRANDQSGRAFREAGIVEMLPALRGTSGAPGKNECFFGEVDDVIAAAAFLAQRPDVDPQRIYLGGHSTGGTLAALVAASTNRFRAIIAFGPVGDIASYGPRGCLPEDASRDERRARRPVAFASTITTPFWAIEGALSSIAASLPHYDEQKKSAPVTTLSVPGLDHFAVLAPGTELLAELILADTGPRVNLPITAEAILARAKGR